MGRPPGHGMSAEAAEQVLAQGPAVRQVQQGLAPPGLRHPPLVAGHVRAVELLEQSEAVRRTAAAYRDLLGHQVYFRPTGSGLTVLSLDPSASGLVGVGQLSQLMPSAATLQEQVAGYRHKLACMVRSSSEERLSAAWIDHALSHGLRLPEHPLHLICQEWRFPLEGGGSAKLDLLSVDLVARRLVVIELKSRAGSTGRGGSPQDQAERYAEWLHQGRAFFVPFFQRLARALARAYDGPPELQELTLEVERRPQVLLKTADED